MLLLLLMSVYFVFPAYAIVIGTSVCPMGLA